MLILGIETSCDETAVSVVRTCNDNLTVLSNIVSSQVKIHARWGGVVPNLAAREHLKNIIPVLEVGLKEAQIKPANINLIAVTEGPGLIPALLIGANVAKTLSYVWQKPLAGIHHIEGHIYANFINEIGAISNFQFPISKHKEIKFPILCLVVSGGHTQLVLMKKHLNYEIIGQTLDDAAGEAFDKVARILNLGYPGGPAVEKEARKLTKLKAKSYKIKLPRPMINSDNLNFSFSGLKTAVLYETKKLKAISYKLKAEIAHEFQQSVIDVLVTKTLKAAKIYNPKTVMLAGGVSANIELRNQLRNNLRRYFPNAIYKIPDIKYSLDNAAMIAAAGYWRWKNMSKIQRKKSLQNWKVLQPDANLKLK
jgi:N6-L-threonylcarbamoyladenine synthase